MKHGYTRRKRNGLRLRDDTMVSYGKSYFKARKCYFVEWSRIEFIWVEI